MEHARILTSLPDDVLLHRLSELLGQSRRVEAEIVAHISEVDARRLYAREAAPSMFAYCTEVLHLSGIAQLAPHLNAENRHAVLSRAVHKSKREIQDLVAELAPTPDAPTVVRKVPQPVQLRPDGVEASVRSAPATAVRPVSMAPLTPPVTGSALRASPSSIQALAPARYKIQFTATAELCRKIDRLKALMRCSIPDGDLGAIIEDAVSEKLARLEARRFAQTAAPRKSLHDTSTSPRSRYVPAAVRRAVYQRDGGRCTFVDERGRRCGARDRLEFHHRVPFGYGGAHDPENLSLMCRTHNAYLGEVDYGKVDYREERVRGRPGEHGPVSERRAAYWV